MSKELDDLRSKAKQLGYSAKSYKNAWDEIDPETDSCSMCLGQPKEDLTLLGDDYGDAVCEKCLKAIVSKG